MPRPETRPTPVKIPQWAIRLLVAVALPGVACFAYYAVSALGESHFILALSVTLAYPAALIGLIGLINILISPQRTRLKIAIWSLVMTLPVVLLVAVQA